VVQVEVVNVVGHLDFQRELALSAVADLLRTSEYVSRVRYEPGENHWLQSWIVSPETGAERYVSFYRSGTAMVTGCTSIQEFEAVADRVEEVMRPAVDAEVLRDVKNIVATGTVDAAFDLSKLAILLGLDVVEYEPEQFPGLMYRDTGHGCVFLVFASGKIVCTGVDDVSDAEAALREFTEEHLTQV
jgi:transcription initiation factor TFIID TATA-box-binding protein